MLSLQIPIFIRILLPGLNDSVRFVQLQGQPKSLTFSSKNLVSDDPSAEQWQYFCSKAEDNSDSLFVQRECKSPYASYYIQVENSHTVLSLILAHHYSCSYFEELNVSINNVVRFVIYTTVSRGANSNS